MCGICGIWSPGAPPDPALAARMSARLAHRGPDGDGAVATGDAVLAMRRLAVIDPAHGQQPLRSEDGMVHVIGNGEIYGYAAQREALVRRGHRFATGSDIEVALHLYEEHGPAFLHELRGMFALAIHDAREGRLLLARDRFGVKPLVYAHDPAAGRLGFASELKALLELPWVAREVDPEALETYLAVNAVMPPRTMLRDVRRLPAGHLLIADAGGVRVERWARDLPWPVSAQRRDGRAALAAELDERLDESVATHLVADVPVGILLSGGVDSGVVCAMAARHAGAGVQTFTVGFGERSFDELAPAREVARRYGTDHHELVVTAQDAAAHLGDVAQTFCEPRGDATALPYWLAARLAAERVKVVLSGEGGDELFGGYPTYLADRWGPLAAPPARALLPLVRRLPSSSGRLSLDYRLRRLARGAGLGPRERHHPWKEILGAAGRAAVIAPERRVPVDPLAVHRARYLETEGCDPLARMQDVDLGTFLADDLLPQTDRGGMAHGLEIRVPFVDVRVAEFARALPARAKLRGRTSKAVLRDVGDPLLPRGVARGAKKGFVAPAAAWLRGPLLPFAREVLAPEVLRGQGWLHPGAVGALLDDHVARRDDHSRALWALMAFTLWHDAHVRPGAGGPSVTSAAPIASQGT
jgi:asparagine synthase (glutamine-hydrolysing)